MCLGFNLMSGHRPGAVGISFIFTSTFTSILYPYPYLHLQLRNKPYLYLLLKVKVKVTLFLKVNNHHWHFTYFFYFLIIQMKQLKRSILKNQYEPLINLYSQIRITNPKIELQCDTGLQKFFQKSTFGKNLIFCLSGSRYTKSEGTWIPKNYFLG